MLDLAALALATSVSAIPALPVAAPTPAPIYCPVEVITDNVLPFAFKPVIRLKDGCPWGGHARVRKSSTLNTKRDGAPYQPIRPEQGAWTVTTRTNTIPARELWTLWSWRWEWFDGSRWRAAEVR